MPSRLSYLVVALGNAPRHPLRRGISLTLLLGWVVGVVLLPPPFGPMSPKISPSFTEKDTSPRTSRSP